MRMIDADVLLEEMAAGCLPVLEKGISEITGDNDSIKDYIDRAPTIDAEPVVHAEWIRDECDPTSFRCSACGGAVTGWHHLAECAFNGCPWCLARMDGGVSDG